MLPPDEKTRLPCPAIPHKILALGLVLFLVAACAPSLSPPGITEEPVPALTAPPFALSESVPGTVPPGPSSPELLPFGQDITRDLPPGDPVRGELLFGPQGEFCTSCHSQLLIGPPMGGTDELSPIRERAAERLIDPAYGGRATSSMEYLVESIVDPQAFTVPGYPAGNMPEGYGLLLSVQDISDLIAYLLSLQ